MSIGQIEQMQRYEQSDLFSDTEKDVLRFAEQWTIAGKVEEDVMVRLKSCLSPSDLVLLAATVGQANMTSRFNNAFGTELP